NVGALDRDDRAGVDLGRNRQVGAGDDEGLEFLRSLARISARRRRGFAEGDGGREQRRRNRERGGNAPRFPVSGQQFFFHGVVRFRKSADRVCGPVLFL